MSQRYNDNIKRPKLQDTQLGILNIYVFCREVEQRASGPGKSAAGVIYLSIRIHPNSCNIFPLKAAGTLLSGSRKGAIGA